jgi:hypothetical protein
MLTIANMVTVLNSDVTLGQFNIAGMQVIMYFPELSALYSDLNKQYLTEINQNYHKATAGKRNG